MNYEPAKGYFYNTTLETEEAAKRSASNTKNHETFFHQREKKNNEKAIPIIVNDVQYDSINHTSRALNINIAAIKKALKELEKTKMSFIEKNMKVTTTFKFSKKKRESLE